MQMLLQDIRYASRQLRRSPGFTAAAVLTFALGIGANIAVFTLVQSVLLAPLHFHDAGRIVALNTRWDKRGRQTARMTGGDIADLKAQASSFDALAYYQAGEFGVQLRDHATFVGAALTNADFGRVFSLQPSAGRFFSNGDAKHSAVVSSAFAINNFGSVASAVGQTLSVEGNIYDITGVLPEGFHFPGKTNVWVGGPAVPDDRSHDAFNYNGAIAKLKPGAGLSSAQAQLDAIGARLRAAYPQANLGKSFVTKPLQEQLVGGIRPMLLLLAGAVGLVLLIACVNVAHLQLARATNRFREIAVRSALGATQWQVARQILTESLLLAIAGSIAGVLLAIPLLKLLVSMAPADLPRLGEIRMDPWVLLFAFIACLFSTMCAGLLPALQARRLNLTDALKQDAARGLSTRHVSRLRSGLVIAEVALTFVLAVAAGLLGRTLLKLTTVDNGFSSQGLLVMYAHAPAKTLDEHMQKTREFEQLFDQLRVLPGVQRVAAVMGLPAGEYGSNGSYVVHGSGKSMQSPGLPESSFSVSSPGYFSTLGIPLLKGRDFSSADRYESENVAIISAALARQSFAGQDPIGRQILCGLDDKSEKWMTIVGVVGDVRQDSPAAQPGAALYMPLAQHPLYASEVEVVMRTAVAPLSLQDTVQKQMRALDPEIATRFTTLDLMLQDSIAAQRFRTTLIALFAVLGLLLAMLGVYGVMGYMVVQRRFEVGVRLTFGAVPRNILRMILRQAMSAAAVGILIGFVCSLVAVRLVSKMLFGVTGHDPFTFAAVTGLLLSTALLAAYIPARRAAATDPMQSLRAE